MIFFYCRYGLGSIYIKQEKYQLAEIHFKKALSIHPTSTVIMCIIGVVRVVYLLFTLFCIFFFSFIYENTVFYV